MRWIYEVHCQNYMTSGNFVADTIPEVIEQVHKAVTEEWANVPFYDGTELRVAISLQGLPRRA